jgi:hypothetical protein
MQEQHLTQGGLPMNQRQKPVAKLIGENGNIFNLLGIASRALKEAGQHEQAAKMFEEIKGCGSYENALAIIADYVEVE